MTRKMKQNIEANLDVLVVAIVTLAFFMGLLIA
jgi:hypothetical protein